MHLTDAHTYEDEVIVHLYKAAQVKGIAFSNECIATTANAYIYVRDTEEEANRLLSFHTSIWNVPYDQGCSQS